MAWAPDYCTLAELKRLLRIPEEIETDDPDLAVYITSASRAVDGHTHRQFGSVTAEARTYPLEYRPDKGRWVAVIDDVFNPSGAITVGGTAVTGYRFGPANAAAEGRPYERLELSVDTVVDTYPDPAEVTLTEPWGWPAVPSAAKLGTLLQASRFSARRESPYGVAGSPDLGSEVRLLSKLDPDVGVALRSYVRLERPQ